LQQQTRCNVLLSKPSSFDADILYKGIHMVQNASYMITCCAKYNGIWTSVVNIHSHRTSTTTDCINKSL